MLLDGTLKGKIGSWDLVECGRGTPSSSGSLGMPRGDGPGSLLEGCDPKSLSAHPGRASLAAA